MFVLSPWQCLVFTMCTGALLATPHQPPPYDGKPPPILLVLSVDGFRYDYYDEISTPNLHKIATEGVRAAWVNNIFVTKTFPNHFSIVTGLYAESHGIVDNMFFDPKLNKTFKYYENTEAEFWDVGGVPVWVLNQEQNAGKLYSGGVMWPGSDSSIHNQTAFHYVEYSENITFKARTDIAISFFMNTTHPANVVFLYFDEPDATGHTFGPNSFEIKKKVFEVDQAIGYLIFALKKASLYDRLDLIITSDHGMEEVTRDRIIQLDDIISRDFYDIVNGSIGPILGLNPKLGATSLVYQILKNASRSRGSFDVYLREEIPEEWHYTNNQRIMPVLVVAKLGFHVVQEYLNDTREVFGVHGYNNSYDSMHPIFFARGPSFKKAYESEPIDMLDLYPLMCYILGLQPAPNNGSLEDIKHILSTEQLQRSVLINSILLGVVSSLLMVCVVWATIMLLAANRRDNINKTETLDSKTSDESQLLLDPDELEI